MATLKDIATLAGVSQGTVSNVLNGRGNVSSQKIRLVEAAAAQLGYTVNERAQLLRKGRSNILAVVIPDTRLRQYNDIYASFKVQAERLGYAAALYLTEDTPAVELELIAKLRSDMVAGAAVISCLENPAQAYTDAGFSRNELIFLERERQEGQNYIGFDYAQAGGCMGERLAGRFARTLVLTKRPPRRDDIQFLSGFQNAVSTEKGQFIFSQVKSGQWEKDIIKLLSTVPQPDCICTDSFAIAEALACVRSGFYPELAQVPIYTVSPLKLLPDSLYEKYELDYHQLGHRAAQCLAEQLRGQEEAVSVLLRGAGFRCWNPAGAGVGDGEPLKLLILNGPEASAVQYLSRLYTQKTGVPILASVSSYDEIFEILSTTGGSAFDILRIDITFLSWFARRLLIPLEELDSGIADLLPQFLEGVSRRYSTLDGKIYALPFSPSVQLLYYRQDLFSSTALRRLYHERYRRELTPPESFVDFNRIAAFFTRSLNPDSPVEYGTSLTLGSIGVAGSEFMARFLENRRNLYDDQGVVALNGPSGLKALSSLIGLKDCAPKHANAWWTDTARDFANGKLAMTILYSNYASDLLQGNVPIRGKIGCTLVPGRNPVLGGASLGIARSSRKKEQALDFIKWLCSEPAASAFTLLGGISPCRSVYSNYELLDMFPWLELAEKSFSMADGYRQPPDDSRPFNERQLLNIIGMAVKNAYSGVQSPKEALDWAQQRYDLCFGDVKQDITEEG